MKKVYLLFCAALILTAPFTHASYESSKEEVKTESKEKAEAPKISEGEVIEAARETEVKTKPRRFIGKSAAATAAAVPPIKTNKPVVEEPKLKKAPGDFASLFLKAVELEQQEKYPEALEVYNEALAIRRDAPGAIIRKGICQIRLGQNEDGVRTILEGLDMKPVTKGDYMTMSWVKSTAPVDQLRDGTLAVVFAQRVLESGQTPEGLDLLAAGYAEMGNFQQARETLMRALKSFPDASNAAGMRTRLELNTNRQRFREEWTAGTEKEAKKLNKDVEKSSERNS
jgi:tetratricopeptide (TPR) repeat protein